MTRTLEGFHSTRSFSVPMWNARKSILNICSPSHDSQHCTDTWASISPAQWLDIHLSSSKRSTTWGQGFKQQHHEVSRWENSQRALKYCYHSAPEESPRLETNIPTLKLCQKIPATLPVNAGHEVGWCPPFCMAPSEEGAGLHKSRTETAAPSTSPVFALYKK